MATSDSTPTKRCSKCGVEYPATTEFFRADKNGKGGFRASCRVCERAYADAQRITPERQAYIDEWKNKNRQKSRDYSKKSRLKHIDKRRAEDRQFAREHSKERMAYNDEWRKKNPDKQRAIQKRHYWKHRDVRLAKNKDWRQTPHGKAVRQALEFKRRSSKKYNGGTYTAQDIELHFRTQKGLCWWCGQPLDPKNYHVDHRIALSRGGMNSAKNICISCPECNLKKSDKYPWHFNGRLL